MGISLKLFPIALLTFLVIDLPWDTLLTGTVGAITYRVRLFSA